MVKSRIINLTRMNQPAVKSNAVLTYSVIVIVVILAGLGIYWFVKKDDSTLKDGGAVNQETSTYVNANTNAAGSSSTYIGDGFTVLQPSGWIQSRIQGSLASFQRANESHGEGSPAEKINFKSYIAISFDSTNGRTLDQVDQATIDGITAAIPSAKSFAVNDETINGIPARLTAFELQQQDVSYTVLVAVFMADEKYYVMSFNTTTEKWIGYKDSFYEVARSFSLKD